MPLAEENKTCGEDEEIKRFSNNHPAISGRLSIYGVRCCKPPDLTYTLDLEKQLKNRNDFKNLFD